MVGILHLDCGLHFPYMRDAEGTQICTVVQQFKISVLNRFSHFGLFPTLSTVACQAPLSMVFPRQEYWSGLPFLSPGDLLNPGIEPTSLMSPSLALAGRFFTISTTSRGTTIMTIKVLL